PIYGLEQLDVDALLVDDEARRVGAGDHLRAQLDQLLDGVDGDVARAGHDADLAVQGLAPRGQHLADEVDRPVAGRLGAHQGAAPVDALAGEHAGLVAVGDPLVLAEEVADLAGADADVAGRDVGVLPQVPVELGHQALAEPHDLALAAALGGEVRAP